MNAWLRHDMEEAFDELIQELEVCGKSRELSVAITNLQTAKLWAMEHKRVAEKNEERI